MWEDQRIVARPRYRDLISAFRFVARQELIFGMHVHVGIDDPDKAIHVANGMRVHVPVLLGLSANSPFWRGDATGLASTRTPIFRAFPRVGIPPTYKSWEDYEKRIEFMVNARGKARKIGDRKSTRLNSSHANISYAVFCLKKNKSTRSTWRDKPY